MEDSLNKITALMRLADTRSHAIRCFVEDDSPEELPDEQQRAFVNVAATLFAAARIAHAGGMPMDLFEDILKQASSFLSKPNIKEVN